VHRFRRQNLKQGTHSKSSERLEVVETGRRRRWSDDEKLRIVIESFQAPRAISSTARRHGISRSLLMIWRRSFGPEPISPRSEQSGFARVILAAEVEPAVAATSTSGQMVIVVGMDRRVIVNAGVDAAALARVRFWGVDDPGFFERRKKLSSWSSMREIRAFIPAGKNQEAGA
jgi:transposase